jgi:organic radical activating enzyme
MMGKNPIRKQDLSQGNILRVQEIFATIQGEGPFGGLPAVFIRMWGCNLKCWWCDTDFESSKWNPTVEVIAARVNREAKALGQSKYGQFPFVVLTGGEPLRQDIIPLLKVLTKKYHVQIETNGTLWVPGLHEYIASGRVTLVCSPKTPKVDPNIVEWCDDWKYISDGTGGTDGLPIENTQARSGKKDRVFRPPTDRNVAVWLQPLDHGDDRSRSLRVAYLCMDHGYRLCLQAHKIVGVP